MVIQDLRSRRDALSLAHEQLKKIAIVGIKGLLLYPLPRVCLNL